MGFISWLTLILITFEIVRCNLLELVLCLYACNS